MECAVILKQYLGQPERFLGGLAMSDLRPRLIALDEACQLLGVSVYTLRRYAAYGRIKIVKLGTRVMVLDSEIERIQREGLEAVPLGTPLPRRGRPRKDAAAAPKRVSI
jgi:excisionase family DNA binding protein